MKLTTVKELIEELKGLPENTQIYGVYVNGKGMLHMLQPIKVRFNTKDDVSIIDFF